MSKSQFHLNLAAKKFETWLIKTLEKKMRGLLLILGIWSLASAYPQKNTHQDGSGLQTSISGSIGKFHSKLWPEITSHNPGNIIYSPLSLHLALTEAYIGAPQGSNTSSELESLLQLGSEDLSSSLDDYKKTINSVLEIPQQAQNYSSIRIVDRMYRAEDLNVKETFLDNLKNYFSSTVERVDFSESEEAAGKINQFVSDQTNGLIKDLFQAEDFDADTRFVLLNAIFFKGLWKNRFTGVGTSSFNVDPSRQVDYTSMSITDDFKVIRFDDLNSNILELPYKNGKTSMVVVLPDEDIDIRHVESRLEKIRMESMFEQLAAAEETPSVEVVFPEFEAIFDFSGDKSKEALMHLGVKSIFDKTNCDLSEISNEPIYVDQVAHKAVIRINRRGTEAAAASGVAGVLESLNIPSSEFIVDRPFLFFIIDQSHKLPLFAGRIVDPSGKYTLI